MNKRKLRQNKLIIEKTAVILWLTVIAMLVHYHVKTTFTEKKWLDNPDERTHIVQDLIEKHKLIGMSEDEVTALLGPESGAQSSFKNDHAYYPPETTLVYFLGYELIDGVWLVLPLENGIVQDIVIGVT